jgi:acyl carrier protein
VTTESRLVHCFAVVFPHLSVPDIVHATVFDVPAWDSMSHLTLLAVIEEEFGVAVAVDDIERLTSFAAIVDHLGARV